MSPAEYMRKIIDEMNGVSSVQEGPQILMENYESIKEAQSWAQQAAIAIHMKENGDEPKHIDEGPNDSPLTFQGTKKWKNEKDFFKKWFSRPFLTHEK